MAATLQERVIGAKANPRVRNSELQDLAEDLRKEKERLIVLHQLKSADSINFALSDRDRDEAANLAASISRTLQGLETEISAIADLQASRQNSEKAAKLRKEREAALAERDALAAELPALYAEAAGKLITMAQRIMASDERLRLCGLGNETSAEAIARGCNGLFHKHMAPLVRLTQIRLPEFDNAGELWPRAEFNLASVYTGALENMQRNYVAAQQARAAVS